MRRRLGGGKRARIGELKLALRVKALERELRRLREIVEEGEDAYGDLAEAEEELELERDY